MTEGEIIAHASQGLYLVLILSMPPIAVAASVGIFLALIQALTQIQEQTLQFVVKLTSVVVVLMASMGWIGGELIAYTLRSMEFIARSGGLSIGG